MAKIENLKSSDTITPEILIKQWLNGIKISHIAHQRVAARYTHLGRMLGIPVTISTIIIGTSVFGALMSSENQWILIFTGMISIIAAILSGLQTFLKYPDMAHKHHIFGMKYGILRRKVEEFIAFRLNSDSIENEMKELREEWDKLTEEAPEIPQRYIDVALRKIKPVLPINGE